MLAAMAMTGASVAFMESARPWMMVVAWPGWDAFAIPRTGE
jgi:hypothetical protein